MKPALFCPLSFNGNLSPSHSNLHSVWSLFLHLFLFLPIPPPWCGHDACSRLWPPSFPAVQGTYRQRGLRTQGLTQLLLLQITNARLREVMRPGDSHHLASHQDPQLHGDKPEWTRCSITKLSIIYLSVCLLIQSINWWINHFSIKIPSPCTLLSSTVEALLWAGGNSPHGIERAHGSWGPIGILRKESLPHCLSAPGSLQQLHWLQS